MLIPNEMLAKVQALTVVDLKIALANAGYTFDDRISACEFLGMDTNGTFAYSINYDAPDTEKGWGTTQVYITIVRRGVGSTLIFTAEY